MNEPQPLEPVSIEASLTESGVSLQTQSRFVSAVDRLFGGLFAWPAAYLDGRISKKKLLDEIARGELKAKSELRLEGELKAEELRLAVAYMRQRKEAEAALNLTAVTTLALEDLRASDVSEGTDNKTDEPVSDDWLNWFRSYAEKAKSDDIRELWGRILADEVRSPGRFSISTLRVLSETDRELAELFQTHVDHVLFGKYLVKIDNEFKGQKLLELTELEDAGFLKEVNGNLGIDQNFSESGSLVIENDDIVLLAEANPNDAFRVSVILISRAGRELLQALPKIPPDRALRVVAGLLPGSTKTKKLGKITHRPSPNQIAWTFIQEL